MTNRVNELIAKFPGDASHASVHDNMLDASDNGEADANVRRRLNAWCKGQREGKPFVSPYVFAGG